MKKLPAIMFYIGDWRKDPGVQSMSYEERGIWLEILMFMHESERRGLLLLNGHPPTDSELGRMLGISEDAAKQIQAKLLNNGVASREQKTNALMSRKMFKLHDVRSKAGKIGANKRLANVKQTLQAKPSTSISISFSTSKNKNISSRPSHLTDEDFIKNLQANPAYKHINIPMELGKMDAWLSVKPGKKKTRRFIVNWLNRIDPGLQSTVVGTRPVAMWECFVCKKRMPETDRRTHMEGHTKEVAQR